MRPRADGGLGALELIDPWKIDFDQENPRREDEDAILADPEFNRLKDSISAHGVLVPIVVRRRGNQADRYILVDGERRLRAARFVNESSIPANIVSGDQSSALAKAFQIHTLRKQWGQVAQVRAVKRMMQLAISEDAALADDQAALRRRLQDLTGFDANRVDDLVRTATLYSEENLDEAEAGKIRFSHFIQIEESFINQVRTAFPEVLAEVGEETVREVMLDKARHKVLTDTRVLMDELVPIFSKRATGPGEKQVLKGLVRDFIEDPPMPVEDVVRKYNEHYPPGREDVLRLAKDAQSQVTRLASVLDALEIPALRTLYPQVAAALAGNLRTFRTSISSAIRRLAG